MDFVNALGPRLFGQDYLPLAPVRKPGSGPAMEVIQLKKSHPHHVAERIHALLHEGKVAVRDRESEALRPAEPRDVAVLCLTHKNCAKYAEALRALELPVRLAESDRWASPVVQAATFALRLATDPRDRHAALCVATLGPMALPLDKALRLLARGEELAAPELDALASLHAAGCGMTIERLRGEVLRVTGLRAWCDRLDYPAQMRATMPELGTIENKQAASLAGLAPIARQSSQWKGKSFIRGGRANVRQALYMPALVAARFNADLKAKYQQLTAAGKPAKIAIMRKLVVTANALLKADRCWQQSIACSSRIL
ncbi:MAG TPA: transposase [Novosphingobium sp.]|nr:transposase [Burkholderiaceae bacterium]